MALLTMDAVEEALKSYYLSGLREQLNYKTNAFLAEVEKTSESVVGKEIVMALRYGRVGGIGNRADDGTLPTPNSRKTKQAKWETKNIYARFQITGKTIAASKTDTGAFANMLNQEIEDCETDAKLDLARQAMGDGDGTLAVVDSCSDEDGDNEITVKGSTMFFAQGMLVDVLESDGSSRITEKEVLAVPDDETVIIEDYDDSIGDGDIIVVHGNYEKELTGLEAVVTEDTELYGIDRSENQYKFLNPIVIDVDGELSETVMQQGIDEVDVKSGSTTDFIICSKGVNRAFQNLQTTKKQHVNTLDLEGGWTALSYNGMPLVADKFVKEGRMYGLDMNDWALYQMEDWDWMDRDGSMLNRVSDKDAWEATLLKYCDLGCQRPRGQFLLENITEH